MKSSTTLSTPLFVHVHHAVELGKFRASGTRHSWLTWWRCRPRRSGTGSHPPGCQGAHFASRTTVSAEPLIAPWVRIASTAYSLQVGVNRQVGRRSGDTYVRYSSMRKIRTRAGKLRSVVHTVPKRRRARTGLGPRLIVFAAHAGLPSSASRSIRRRTDRSCFVEFPGSCGRRSRQRANHHVGVDGESVDQAGADMTKPAGDSMTNQPPVRQPCSRRARNGAHRCSPGCRSHHARERGRPDPVYPYDVRHAPSRRNPRGDAGGTAQVTPRAPEVRIESGGELGAALRRRAETIARPARVRIRRRKP